ncbi:MAG: DUF1269 domain-containing protein [Rhodospirillales bacterium]|nr:DUF1269 domain-containing protein [Rhodospirillales bacterium]
MSDLIAIAFASEEKAEAVRRKILDMQKEYLIEVNDMVVAVKQPNGHVRLNQMFHPTAAGAAAGSFWGLLVGLLFMMPLLGVAVGAGVGAIGGALTDFGINDRFMKDLAEALPPNGAALFVLVRKMTTDKVLADLKGVGGTVLKTSLDLSKEAALRDALAGEIGAAAG